MSYHILFEGGCFVLSYPTHIWNAYVAEFFYFYMKTTSNYLSRPKLGLIFVLEKPKPNNPSDEMFVVDKRTSTVM